MSESPKFVAMQSTRKQDTFWIHWNLSKRCNFNCAYCPEALHDMTSKHRSLDNLISIAKKIKKNIPDKKIRIWFTGGEPTANPNFLAFCKYLKENDITNLGLNSNGSRNVKYYLELIKYVNKIQLSSHFEFMNIDKFLENLEFLPQKNVSLNLMAEPEHWDKVKRLVGFCEQRGINYHLKRIRPKIINVNIDIVKSKKDIIEYIPPYTEDQIEWLEEREHVQLIDDQGNNVHKPDILVYEDMYDEPKEKWANDYINNQQDNFFGWLCGVGLEGIEINANGTIHRGVCGVGGNISHIDDEDWKLPNNFVMCNKTRCTCVADWKSTKYKSHYVRKELRESISFEIYKNKGSLDSQNY
jgi:organic radical activating enzyme